MIRELSRSRRFAPNIDWTISHRKLRENLHLPHKNSKKLTEWFHFKQIKFHYKFHTGSLVWWVERSLVVWKTWVQSQVTSYQRLKKMVLDTSLLNTQQYKVRIKGKVEQSRERSSALPYTSV